MQAYDIGISALRSHQTVLTLAGQNIANSSTPGYHRQRADLATRRSFGQPDLEIGSGVDVSRIRRLRDVSLEQTLLTLSSQLAASEADSRITSQIEQVLTPGTGSIQQRLSEFFDRLEDLANAPTNSTARQAFVNAARQFSESANDVDSQWRDLQTSLAREAELGVRQVNELTNQLFKLDGQIRIAASQGDVPNALLDRRDQILAGLSEWIDVSVSPGTEVPPPISLGPLGYFKNQVVSLSLQGSPLQGIAVVSSPNNEALQFTGGKLAALLHHTNTHIPAIRERFAEMVDSFALEFNRLHSVGLPGRGGLTRLTAATSVTSSTAPLENSLDSAVLRPGEIFVTVTRLDTNTRQTHRIAIDPASSSLQDITNALDSLTGVAAFIDPLGRQILSAESGFRFDFTGRIDPTPQVNLWNGTSSATVTGSYKGAENDEWTFQIVGSGSIGVTPGLELEIRNANGNLISRHTVGQGYEAGTSLQVADGVSISLTAGTVTSGDSLSSLVIATPDTSGYLTALGLNSLFTGKVGEQFAVREEILADPRFISLSRNGLAGDAQIAERMLALRTQRFLDGGISSPVEALASLTAELGIDTRSSSTEASFLQDQFDGARTRQQEISGVNLDEELITLVEAQRAYQAAAKYLTTLSSALDELLNLVR